MAIENQHWNVKMRYCCSNSNPSPQVLDWNWNDDVIAYGSHNTLHILEKLNGCYCSTQVLTGHTSRVNCVKWITSPNPSGVTGSNFLVSGSASGELKVWQGKAKFECTQALSTGTGSVSSIAARMTSSTALIASSATSNVFIFRRKLGVENDEFKEFHRISFGYNYILGLDISFLLTGFSSEAASDIPGDNKSNLFPILACGSDNGQVLVFGLHGEVIRLCELSGHEDWVRSVEFCGTPEELYLASASQDFYVRIWRISPKIESGEPNILKLKEILFGIPSQSGIVSKYLFILLQIVSTSYSSDRYVS